MMLEITTNLLVSANSVPYTPIMNVNHETINEVWNEISLTGKIKGFIALEEHVADGVGGRRMTSYSPGCVPKEVIVCIRELPSPDPVRVTVIEFKKRDE